MDNFFSLYFLGSKHALIAEESLPSCIQLREPLVNPLLITIIIDDLDILKLIYALLRHSFIIVLLFRSQICKIDVHFCLRCAVFINCIIRCLSFREDAATIISLFDSVWDGIDEVGVDLIVFTDLHRTEGTLVC